ncbi:hypothetical protein IMCC9480_1318 [Oxalobacteraceae bacterium IMCC9480]|nr:hypothetical protein IMCC9480_1318 [Oxalobacteraceae bacterium IMCC9480]NDP57800.1 hypothetical protein [Oxalobacteraceae bacterium]
MATNIDIKNHTLKVGDVIFSKYGNKEIIDSPAEAALFKNKLQADDIIVSTSGSVVEYRGNGQETVLLDRGDIDAKGATTGPLTKSDKTDDAIQGGGKPSFWQRLSNTVTEKQKEALFNHGGLGAGGGNNQFKGQAQTILAPVLTAAKAASSAHPDQNIETVKGYAQTIELSKTLWDPTKGFVNDKIQLTREGIGRALKSPTGFTGDEKKALQYFYDRPALLHRLDTNLTSAKNYSDGAFYKENLKAFRANPSHDGANPWGTSPRLTINVEAVMHNPAALQAFKVQIAGRISGGESLTAILEGFKNPKNPNNSGVERQAQDIADYYLKMNATDPTKALRAFVTGSNVEEAMRNSGQLVNFKQYVTDQLRTGKSLSDIFTVYNDPTQYKSDMERAAVDYYKGMLGSEAGKTKAVSAFLNGNTLHDRITTIYPNNLSNLKDSVRGRLIAGESMEEIVTSYETGKDKKLNIINYGNDEERAAIALCRYYLKMGVGKPGLEAQMRGMFGVT